ncbi:MAG: type II toxin-antitoxin system VapC family toxin [Spirochaetales bacterium]|nr:type II toxin-antitoxin system VapC family toxin [Spirochaetales bacterium]
MKYFLDTNICIYALKSIFPQIQTNMEKKHPSDIAIPAIVKAELYYGAQKSLYREKVIKALDSFLKPFFILPFDDNASLWYAKIRAGLEKKGNIIGPNDLIIASCAMAYGGILVTHNIKEFQKVDGLYLEDWTDEDGME